MPTAAQPRLPRCRITERRWGRSGTARPAQLTSMSSAADARAGTGCPRGRSANCGPRSIARSRTPWPRWPRCWARGPKHLRRPRARRHRLPRPPVRCLHRRLPGRRSGASSRRTSRQIPPRPIRLRPSRHPRAWIGDPSARRCARFGPSGAGPPECLSRLVPETRPLYWRVAVNSSEERAWPATAAFT
jgi:hypothetical protein